MCIWDYELHTHNAWDRWVMASMRRIIWRIIRHILLRYFRIWKTWKKKKFSKNGKIAPRQLHKSVRGTDGNSIQKGLSKDDMASDEKKGGYPHPHIEHKWMPIGNKSLNLLVCKRFEIICHKFRCYLIAQALNAKLHCPSLKNTT